MELRRPSAFERRWIFALLLLTAGTNAGADEPRAQLRLHGTGDSKIQNLSWSNPSPEIEIRKSGGVYRAFVTLDGNYPKLDWTLSWHSGTSLVTIWRGRLGGFHVEVPLSFDENRIEFVAVSPYGKVEKQAEIVEFPGLEKMVREAALKKSAPVTTLVASVGAQNAYLNFSQSFTLPITEYALNPHVSLWTVLPGKLPFTADVNLVATPFFAAAGGTGVRELFFNFHLGYVFRVGKWELIPRLGWYFSDLFPSTPTYGFQNLSGPEFLPTIRFNISEANSVFLTANAAPAFDGFIPIGSSYQFGFALGYSRRLNERLVLTPSLNYQNLQLVYGTTTIQTSIFAADLTLEVGIL
ncbi:MAG: hypothetical protein ACXWPM_08835 [Bdellovibrionota bacterium]